MELGDINDFRGYHGHSQYVQEDVQIFVGVRTTNHSGK